MKKFSELQEEMEIDVWRVYGSTKPGITRDRVLMGIFDNESAAQRYADTIRGGVLKNHPHVVHGRMSRESYLKTKQYIER